MPTEFFWRVVWNNPGPVTKRLRDRVDVEISAASYQILALAQDRVNVLTGATRDSGQVVKMGICEYQVVFGGAALWLELGTSHAPPYPFLLSSVFDGMSMLNSRLAIVTQGRVSAGLLGQGVGSMGSN